MVLKVFTKGDDSSERQALEIAGEIESNKGNVEYYDLNSDESNIFREVYNIYTSPALFVTQDDGKIIEGWQGEVPTRSEVNNFMRL